MEFRNGQEGEATVVGHIATTEDGFCLDKVSENRMLALLDIAQWSCSRRPASVFSTGIAMTF